MRVGLLASIGRLLYPHNWSEVQEFLGHGQYAKHPQHH